MLRTQYVYTSPFCKGAKVIATYTDGELTELHGLNLIGQLWESIPINAPIPFKESEVMEMARLYDYAVAVSQVEVDRVGGKVAMFCAAYKEALHIQYTMRKGEAAKLEGLEVNQEMLKAYFNNKEWWGKQPKSIPNYASNYNSLKQLLNRKEGAGKTQYPIEPDMNYLKTLSPAEGMKAQQQWYKAGWRPIKSAVGDVIGWTAPAVATLLVICCFLVNSCALFRPAQPAPTSEPVTVITTDTVRVDADTLQGLIDPVALENSGVWNWENDRTSVELVIVDSSQYDSLEAAGWQWLDHDSTVLDGAPVKPKSRPGKAILVRVISKPLEVIEEDTSCVDVPAPVPVYPAIPAEDQVNIWWLISAALALVSGIVFFIRKRKKDGQGDAETEQG